ncbi:MAG: AMP-binding protein, partial [Acidimicrobiales bacterium]
MSLSYAHGGSVVPLLGETIGANLERTVDRYPDNEAVVSRHQERRFTYAQFDEAVDVVARGLLDLGLEAGDRVGMWSPNSYEWLLVQYATAKAGIILVNINPAYRTSELEYAMNQSGCRMLIAAPSFKTSDYVAMIDEVRPKLATLERTVFVGSDDWDALLTAGDSV